MKKRCDIFYDEALKRENWPLDDMCDPPTDATTCMNALIDELLGKDWYVTMPENGDQVRTIATYEIIKKYVDEPKKRYTAWEILVVISCVINLILFFLR